MDERKTILRVEDSRVDFEPFNEVLRPLGLDGLRLNLSPPVAEVP